MYRKQLSKIASTLTLFLLTISLCGQSSQDSLFTVADSAQGQKKLETYIELASNYLLSDLVMADSVLRILQPYIDTTQFLAPKADYYRFKATNYLLQEQYVAAITDYQESLEILHKLDTPGTARDIANCLSNMGTCYSEIGQKKKAIYHFLEGGNKYKEVGSNNGIEVNLINTSWEYAQLGHYKQAEFFYDSLITFQSKNGAYYSAEELLGHIEFAKKNYEGAAKSLGHAAESLRTDEDYYNLINVLFELAECYIYIGELNESAKYLKEAKSAIDEGSFGSLNKQYHKLMSLHEENLGNSKSAFEHLSMYMSIKDSLSKATDEILKSQIEEKHNIRARDEQYHEQTAALEDKQRKHELQRKIYAIIISLCLVSLTVLLIYFIRQRRLSNQLRKSNEEIDVQKQKIASSIHFAKFIQERNLKPKLDLENIFPDSFIFYQPKEAVSGDFYWYHDFGDQVLVSAIDCTGHGVPGAFMSLIAHQKMETIIMKRGLRMPSEILPALHKEIINALHQKNNEVDPKDGMDMSICLIEKKSKTIKFSGAHNSVMLLQNGEIKELGADIVTIGDKNQGEDVVFKTETIKYGPGDKLFLYTDGYMDQFGGDRNKKLNKKNFKKVLLDVDAKGFNQGQQQLDGFMQNWKGKNTQLDDMLIMGINLFD